MASTNKILCNNEITKFLISVNLHNEQFKIKDIKDYRIYYKPFKSDNRLCIRKFLNLTRFKFLCTAIAGWGLNSNTIELFELAKKKNLPFLLFEDGLIRSVCTYVADCPQEFKNGISFMIDTRGFYFDSNVSTNLELLLNNYKITAQEKNYAQKVIEMIKKYRVSKYNSQPLNLNGLKLSEKRNVLVIDQSYGDMSLIRGGITDEIFMMMINDAVIQNPDSQILFKIHPDTMARNDASAFKDNLPKNVVLIDWEINPILLLENTDIVYTATSGMGMEALLMGKEVHCYGMPFYAGWGLTTDRLICERRTRKLDIYELFYITYIKYSTYLDPYSSTKSTIENAIEYICEERNKYLNAPTK